MKTFNNLGKSSKKLELDYSTPHQLFNKLYDRLTIEDFEALQELFSKECKKVLADQLQGIINDLEVE